MKSISVVLVVLLFALAATSVFAEGTQEKKADGPVEIVLWDFWKPDDGSIRGNALGENLRNFHAKFPGIRVKLEVQTMVMVESKLLQAHAVGNTPDVTKLYSYYLPIHVSAGTIRPLNEFARDIDKSDWVVPWDKHATFDGKKYALPFEHRFFALLYRKDILDKAGFTAPTTWDEVCQIGGSINSSDTIGYAFGASQAAMATYMMEWAESVMAAAGGKFFDSKGRAIFNDAAGKKVFNLVADLTGKCRASPKTVVDLTYNEIHTGLKTGTIAMGGLGTHRYESIRAEGAGDNLRWAPPPSFSKGKIAPAPVLGWNYAMCTKAKQPAAAWKFMEYMTSPEAQLVIAKSGEMPTRKSTYNNPWFATPAAGAMREWSDYLAKNGQVLWYPTTWLEFAVVITDGVQNIVLKGADPAQALEGVVANYNAKYAQAK